MSDATGETLWDYTFDGIHENQQTTPQGTVYYTCDGDGRPSQRSINTPAAGYSGAWTNTYDAGGRLTKLQSPTDGATTFSYDAGSRATSKTAGNGNYELYDYDACDQMTSIGYWWADGTGQNALVYSYDAAGNVHTMNQGYYATTYGYDGADQLVSEASTGSYPPPSLGYTYDHNGNRLTQTSNGAQVQSFTYDAHDKLKTGTAGSESDGYDPNGNETSVSINGQTYHFVYDDEDRLTSLTTPNGIVDSFTYNGLGLRVGKTDSTGTYTYLCDGASPGSPVLSDGHTLYTPGLSENTGGASRYYSNDRLGNLWTIDASSKGQLDYQDTTGFGSLIAQSGAGSVFGYGGGNGCQTDADTGLVLMGHRYYDTRIGRFITQDPAGDGDNWYAYAGNSPTNEVDPLGLDPSEIPGFQGQPTGFWPDGEPYFVPNGGPETSATLDDPSSYAYDLDSYGYTGPNGPNTEPASQGGEGSSGTDWAGAADNWVTFGTVTNAGNVAGMYDSGHASRGAAIGAGALAVGAIVAAGANDGEDAEAGVELKAENYLTEELIKESRNIPIKQGEGLARDYGGKAKNWLKKSTTVFQHPGTGEDVEIHWFQNTRDNIGKVLIKWKFEPYE